MTGSRKPAAGSTAPAVADPAGAAAHSAAVAGWTAASRASGLLRVVVIAAVLGPTFFGNLYQATNLFPNLAYELLTGSLFASLLVPALVGHVDIGDRVATERVAGGFLGVALSGFAAVAVAAVAASPLVLRVLTIGVDDPAVATDQRRLGLALVAMLMPQVALYGLIGTAVAVQNAHARFALPAGAPIAENAGIIVVLAGYAAVFGTGTEVDAAGTPQLLLLGLGTTAAVGGHAAVQWWGARRAGVILRPRAGWRDPEVRNLIRLAVPSLGYAGLNASRLAAMLVVASAVPGGVVAFQLAVNFYNLPVALGGRPVAQAALPGLARAHRAGDRAAFAGELLTGARLMLFVTVPAGVAYLVLAGPLARAVSFGEMSGHGAALLAAALAGLALGAVGEAANVLATHGCYARRDASTPLRVMAVRTAASLAGMAGALLLLDGPTLLLGTGLAVTAGDLLAAGLLTRALSHATGGRLKSALPATLGRNALAAAAMALPALLATWGLTAALSGAIAAPVALAGAVLAGLGGYVAAQAALRSPELALMSNLVRTKAVREVTP